MAISEPTLYPDCMGDTSTSITVDGFEVQETYTYGESSETMALDLAGGFSASGSPVRAVASGSTVYLTAKIPGTVGNSYALSASGSECLIRTTYYPIYQVSTSGSTLSGSK